MKGRYIVVFVIFFIITLLLVGCGSKSLVDSEQVSQKTEPANIDKTEVVTETSEKTDPVVEPEVEVIESTEFEEVKKSLFDDGILKEGTPVYRFGETIETEDFSLSLFRFLSYPEDKEVIMLFNFVEVNPEETMKRSIRLVIDDKAYTNGYGMTYTRDDEPQLRHTINSSKMPDPKSYQDHMFILVAVRGWGENFTTSRPFGSVEYEPYEDDVAIIITKEDIFKQ